MLRGYLSRRESQANLLGDCHSVCPEFGSSLDQSRGVDDGRVVEATKLPAHPGPTCALVVAANEPPSDGTRARHRIHPRVGLELRQRQAIVARGLTSNLRGERATRCRRLSRAWHGGRWRRVHDGMGGSWQDYLTGNHLTVLVFRGQYQGMKSSPSSDCVQGFIHPRAWIVALSEEGAGTSEVRIFFGGDVERRNHCNLLALANCNDGRHQRRYFSVVHLFFVHRHGSQSPSTLRGQGSGTSAARNSQCMARLLRAGEARRDHGLASPKSKTSCPTAVGTRHGGENHSASLSVVLLPE